MKEEDVGIDLNKNPGFSFFFVLVHKSRVVEFDLNKNSGYSFLFVLVRKRRVVAFDINFFHHL